MKGSRFLISIFMAWCFFGGQSILFGQKASNYWPFSCSLHSIVHDRENCQSTLQDTINNFVLWGEDVFETKWRLVDEGHINASVLPPKHLSQLPNPMLIFQMESTKEYYGITLLKDSIPLLPSLPISNQIAAEDVEYWCFVALLRYVKFNSQEDLLFWQNLDRRTEPNHHTVWLRSLLSRQGLLLPYPQCNSMNFTQITYNRKFLK